MTEDDTIRALRRISYEKLRADMTESGILVKPEHQEAELDEFLMVRGWTKDELIRELLNELKGMREDVDCDDDYEEYDDYPELDEDDSE